MVVEFAFGHINIFMLPPFQLRLRNSVIVHLRTKTNRQCSCCVMFCCAPQEVADLAQLCHVSVSSLELLSTTVRAPKSAESGMNPSDEDVLAELLEELR